MNYETIVLELIDEEINLSILEKDINKLNIIKNKILNKEILSSNEKEILIEDVISNKLAFDKDGNPIENTIFIEKLIDIFSS